MEPEISFRDLGLHKIWARNSDPESRDMADSEDLKISKKKGDFCRNTIEVRVDIIESWDTVAQDRQRWRALINELSSSFSLSPSG